MEDTVAAALAASAAVASPTPEPTASAEPKPYAINLASAADFVPQYTFDWCVAASIQMAHNLVMPDIRADPTDEQIRVAFHNEQGDVEFTTAALSVHDRIGYARDERCLEAVAERA